MELYEEIYTDEFYNPKLKTKFLVEEYKQYSDVSLLQIINTFKKIAESENERKKDVAFFDYAEFKDMFESNRWIASQVVNNKKAIIKKYLRWYRKNLLENWQEINILLNLDGIYYKDLSGSLVYESEWFRSFEELQSCIDALFQNVDSVDENEFQLPITAIYFAWHLIDINEAIAIKKTDISNVNETITLPISGKVIEFEHKAFNYIHDYANTDGYEILRGNSVMYMSYKNSQFLIRSKINEQLTTNNIRSNLTRFSEAYKATGSMRLFRYDRIFKSSLFSKVINYEREHDIEITTYDVEMFCNITENTIPNNRNERLKIQNQIRDFLQYRDYYYYSI